MWTKEVFALNLDHHGIWHVNALEMPKVGQKKNFLLP
jgi:hypothetical protein